MASALSSGRMPPLVQERPDQASARIGAYRPPIPCQCSISASASSVTAKPPGVRRSASHPSSLWFSCPTFCLMRSEEHTSELQSRGHLVCRLLLEKKKPLPH